MIVQNKVQSILEEVFQPTHLEVLNESHMHNVPEGSESHFRVVVVSKKFEGAKLIQKHQMVNDALAKLLNGTIHALAIVAKTPEQWESNNSSKQSPECLGSNKK